MDELDAELHSTLDEMARLQRRLTALLRGADPRPVDVAPDSFEDLAGTFLGKLDPDAAPVERDGAYDRLRMYGGPWIDGPSIPQTVAARFDDEWIAACVLPPRDGAMSMHRAAAVYAFDAIRRSAERALVAACQHEDERRG